MRKRFIGFPNQESSLLTSRAKHAVISNAVRDLSERFLGGVYPEYVEALEMTERKPRNDLNETKPTEN